MALQNYDIAGAALNAFRTVDESFRSDRREKADAEERKFQRERQTKADQRADEEYSYQKAQRNREETDRHLQAAAFEFEQAQQEKRAPKYKPEQLKALGIAINENDWTAQPHEADSLPKFRAVEELLAARPSIEALINQSPAGLHQAPVDLQERLNLLENSRFVQSYENGSTGTGMAGLFLNKLSDGQAMVTATVGLKDKTGNPLPAQPVTDGASTDPDAPVRMVPLGEVFRKLEGSSLLFKMVQSADPQEYDKAIKSIGKSDIESAIVANGGKGADKLISEKKQLSRAQALLESDAYKKQAAGSFGQVVKSMGELYRLGVAADKDMADLLKLVGVKETEDKVKDDKDESIARTSVAAYLELGSDSPRTAKLAKSIKAKMDADEISGSKAEKILTLVYTTEQKQIDQKNRLAVQKAGVAGKTGERASLLAELEKRFVRDGLSPKEATEKATGLVFGTTKTEMTTGAANNRANMRLKFQQLKILEDKMLMQPSEELQAQIDDLEMQISNGYQQATAKPSANTGYGAATGLGVPMAVSHKSAGTAVAKTNRSQVQAEAQAALAKISSSGLPPQEKARREAEIRKRLQQISGGN